MPEWERGRENYLWKQRQKNKTVYQQRSEIHTHFCRTDFEEQNVYRIIGF